MRLPAVSMAWKLSDGRPRSVVVAYAACALCLIVALLALMWVRDRSDSAGSAPEARENVVSDEGEASAVDDGWLADLTQSGTQALRSEAADSSTERFLSDLAHAAQTGADVDGDGVVAVMWEQAGDLIEPASAVLNAYAAEPTASLKTSGYLDIKGNVWGAIVLDRRGWVDIVYVTTEDDASSTVVRIARMLAAKGAE